mgnify:CR=1 FL=1
MTCIAYCIKTTMSENNPMRSIIAAGDVAGAVGLLTEDRSAKPDASQQKAVAVAAAFLAKQMEE